eukprot:TRINITY_DN8800_c0_g1_i1.p1 TRINITY_DN8800_c0_g1~~TRINITY_DN8800_c0_g1_i1.p1  ORF type:complete len:550 (-),score=115.46 TRINITY_DN8800_c0_g1_i1:63-1712(-)
MDEEPGSETPANDTETNDIPSSAVGDPPPPPKQDTFVVSKCRYWILFLFSLLALHQCNIWITFGPIAPTVIERYGEDVDISLLAAWGPLVYIPATIFSSWLLDKFGLKLSMVLNAFLVAFGAVIRCFIGYGEVGMVLTHTGQIFNAIAGPFCMSAPPLLSFVWFPLQTRTLTTAIGALAGNLGVVVCFTTGFLITKPNQIIYLLVGEAVFAVLLFILAVVYFPAGPQDITLRGAWTRASYLAPAPRTCNVKGEPSVADEEEEKTVQSEGKPDGGSDELAIEMDAIPNDESGAIITGEGEKAEAAPVDTPLSAPSPDASGSTDLPINPRHNGVWRGRMYAVVAVLPTFWVDLGKIMANPAFVLVALACGCTLGLFYGWQAVLLLILGPLGYSQKQVGWMGFTSTLAGITGGVFAGRVADWTGRRMKPVYLTLFAGVTITFVLFCLVTHKIVPFYHVSLVYILITVLTVMLCALVPVLYELAVDITSPVSPSTSCSLINTLINVFCLVFLLIDDKLDVKTLNWTITAVSGFFGLLLISLRCKYEQKWPQDE